ncbi:hypothetical protein IFM89_039226 [Coptis chinensis]|uniref:Reverse transcriptase n=1 Tax=Coptis chinensis TaxID=261450 RepID=A0A835M355_9MAGN|nr:hypothetical protein IFM89_039226 [Coptis chinensis]
MGCIDLAFYNKEWQDSFPSWGHKVVARLCSDHAPLIGWHESIPKPRNAPFKFFNMWLSHPNFMALVKNSWEEYIEGHELFILAQKLKRLKDAIKNWNKHSFGHLGSKISLETKNLEELQQMQGCLGTGTTQNGVASHFIYMARNEFLSRLLCKERSVITQRENCLLGGFCVASISLADGTGQYYLKVSSFRSGCQSPALPSKSFIKVCNPGLPNPPPSTVNSIPRCSRKLSAWVVAVLC